MQRTLDRKRIGLLYRTSVEVSSERAGSVSGSCIVCISFVNGRPVNISVMSFHRQYVGKYLLFVSISPLHCWRFILRYLWCVILHAVSAWNNALNVIHYFCNVSSEVQHLIFQVQSLFRFCNVCYYSWLSQLLSLAANDSSNSPWVVLFVVFIVLFVVFIEILSLQLWTNTELSVTFRCSIIVVLVEHAIMT